MTDKKELLIRSWTGIFVEARVGMDCNIFNATNTKFERRKLTATDLIYLSQSECMRDNCTMLHCQFQAGDEVEYYGKDRNWHPYGKLKNLEWRQGNPLNFRHANPDLRTSPDYEAKA